MGDIESNMYSCPCHEDQVTGYNAGVTYCLGLRKFTDLGGRKREEERESPPIFVQFYFPF